MNWIERTIYICTGSFAVGFLGAAFTGDIFIGGALVFLWVATANLWRLGPQTTAKGRGMKT